MKALPLLVPTLALAACFGPHLNTGASPTSPATTFTCMTTAMQELGFTIVQSVPSTGFLRAQKRDIGSPDSAEYTDLAISIYTNRDGKTQFLVQASRTLGNPSPTAPASGLPTLDSDVKAADAVTTRCGKKS